MFHMSTPFWLLKHDKEKERSVVKPKRQTDLSAIAAV